jgi:hypothetical protein
MNYLENKTAMIDPDDRDGQTCTKCGIGYYYETSIHDDWDGVLHCNNKKCNHEVKRYKWKDNPEPAVEKAKLSPAAQAVLDAVINVAESPDAEAIAAAALGAGIGMITTTRNLKRTMFDGLQVEADVQYLTLTDEEYDELFPVEEGDY